MYAGLSGAEAEAMQQAAAPVAGQDDDVEEDFAAGLMREMNEATERLVSTSDPIHERRLRAGGDRAKHLLARLADQVETSMAAAMQAEDAKREQVVKNVAAAKRAQTAQDEVAAAMHVAAEQKNAERKDEENDAV